MKAAVFGSTGLIGSILTDLLIKDSYFKELNIISRYPITFDDKKAKNHIINFEDKKSLASVVKGCDIIFLCIGTTQREVNFNKSLYKKIDYHIPINVANEAKKAGSSKVLLVSSVGADKRSKNFYTKLKGEVESDLIKVGIQNTFIFRPSLLLGKRKMKRIGEKLAQFIMPKLSFLMPINYKPISAEHVAQSMLNLSKTSINSSRIYLYNDIISSSLSIN